MAVILLVTCNKWPALSQSDGLVAAALQAMGHQVQPIPWQRELTHLKAADLLVLRSNWDYHYDLDGFTAWLAALEAAQVRLYNPPSLVRWNLQKGYLLDCKPLGSRSRRRHCWGQTMNPKRSMPNMAGTVR